MAGGESVSASLIPRSALPESGICALDGLIDGEPASIIVQILDGATRVWRNECPHQGRRLDYAPGKFLIDGANLVCAAHGASFRRLDGFCVAGPCRGESLSALAFEALPDGALRVAGFRTSG
jgi:nitrite reductase/ring-hydroxylating ferredoxin subunit